MKIFVSTLRMAFFAVLTTLVFVHGIFAADRGQINSGETRAGLSITAPSYMDSWTFNGDVNDRVVITAVPTGGTLNTYISLYPPGGGPAEASTSLGKLDCQLKKSGLYTIVIEDFGMNDAGTYNITFLKMPGSVSYPDDLDGGPIASGQTLSGSVNVASDMDAFQFYGDVNDRAVITAVPTSGTLNTYISLYPPGGGPAEASTSLGKLDCQLKKSGLYTIVIEDFGMNDTGIYNITLNKIPATIRPGLYNPCPSLGGLTSGCCSELRWDAVAGATGYDVYFGLDVVQSLNKIANNISVSSLAMPAIANGKTYYWYVVAHTSTGDIIGQWWWFGTFAADFNLDNTVNFIDYAILVQYWSQNNPSVDIAPSGGDGVINYLDVARLVEEWLMTGRANASKFYC